eukprot:CAMPEP_0171064684 /NCGR_PEP_ID=MMETSP0766_2-20121228/6440_1 /TAXON_ID=439317 /ORGANISM="Gambierdiscus australes, Strain CAWD 149" /LENGTH=89 /DNA_ID=CAMNT_0011520745 /DNA_START=293 /DNA_END=562 /DNA_ORIENTATION=-
MAFPGSPKGSLPRLFAACDGCTHRNSRYALGCCLQLLGEDGGSKIGINGSASTQSPGEQWIPPPLSAGQAEAARRYDPMSLSGVSEAAK